LLASLPRGRYPFFTQASLEIDALLDAIDFYTSLMRARFEKLNQHFFKSTLEPSGKGVMGF